MAHCPSQDWDHYAAAQDDTAEAEIAWWLLHKDRVLQVCCALMANPAMLSTSAPENIQPKEIVDLAARVVLEITRRSEPL